MRLNVKALSLAAALLWGAAVLVVAIANVIWPPYGAAFLNLAASIYPGYHPASTAGSVVTVTLYALVDGLVGGALFGSLYNAFAR